MKKKVILFAILLAGLFTSIFFLFKALSGDFLLKHDSGGVSPPNTTATTEEEKKDTVSDAPPVLKLTQDSINIGQGQEIDYRSYIISATDAEDGDLTEQVTYNTIDVNQVGVFTVTYSVTDSAGNTSSADVTVEVIDNSYQGVFIPEEDLVEEGEGE